MVVLKTPGGLLFNYITPGGVVLEGGRVVVQLGAGGLLFNSVAEMASVDFFSGRKRIP